MRARLVDWSLLILVLVEAATGLLSFLEGRPDGRWLFVLHGVLGLALVLLLVWKLRRVWVRLVDRRLWDGATLTSALALAAVLLTLITGVLWTSLHWPLGYPNGLNWHVLFGLVLAVLAVVHMGLRFKAPRRRDFEGRRTVLAGLSVLAVGGALWSSQQVAAAAARLPGAQRRFTGSRRVALESGLTFPVTMWMLDNPAPLDLAGYRLRVGGSVSQAHEYALADLAAMPVRTLEAVLDCTGGWYTQQSWQGIGVGELLASAQPLPAAQYVSFLSATGYRWSVPLAEARTLILATHVGGQPLDHGHGAPLRLVAPNRRGFEWVKWVTEIRLIDGPDLGQWGIIFTSGLEQRPQAGQERQ